MRTRRFLTFLLIVLPSLTLPAVVLAAGTLSGAGRHDEQVAAPVARPPAAPAAPALAIEDHALESRLIHEAVIRAAAEREAAERRAAATRHALRQRIIRERASREAARSRPAPASTPAPAPVQAAGDDVWAKLRRCEAGGRYNANTGNGYYGAYQFAAGTWRALGYTGLPHEAPPEVQDEAARKLQARSGWGQWPACARRLGLR
jgi:hypothetical protein